MDPIVGMCIGYAIGGMILGGVICWYKGFAKGYDTALSDVRRNNLPYTDGKGNSGFPPDD